MLQWLRSLLFTVQSFIAMAVLGIIFSPWALVSPKGARAACTTYCHWIFWSARWMIGLRGKVIGDIPQGEVLIAAKHQSFFDVMLIFEALPAAKFIIKRELMWTPFIGVYAKRLGCVPVDRGKKGQAIDKMLADVEAGRSAPGQLVIYSQGTRVAPGAKKPYKVGTGLLYEQMQQPCIPVATNAGVFWPRSGVMRKPGLATVEFLPAIAPGKTKHELLAELETVIETRSNALMREVGFHAPD